MGSITLEYVTKEVVQENIDGDKYKFKIILLLRAQYDYTKWILFIRRKYFKSRRDHLYKNLG